MRRSMPTQTHSEIYGQISVSDSSLHPPTHQPRHAVSSSSTDARIVPIPGPALAPTAVPNELSPRGVRDARPVSLVETFESEGIGPPLVDSHESSDAGSLGVEANARLTATTGLVLVVLFFFEGLTIPVVGTHLNWHIALGLALIPPVLLKIGSTLWRFGHYYLRDRRYLSGATASDAPRARPCGAALHGAAHRIGRRLMAGGSPGSTAASGAQAQFRGLVLCGRHPLGRPHLAGHTPGCGRRSGCTHPWPTPIRCSDSSPGRDDEPGGRCPRRGGRYHGDHRLVSPANPVPRPHQRGEPER